MRSESKGGASKGGASKGERAKVERAKVSEQRYWVAASMLLFALGAVGHASAEVIEKVVAVVNERAIFLSELRRLVAPQVAAAAAAGQPASPSALYAPALTQMVNDELIRQVGVEMNVRVPTTEVDRAIQTVMQRSGLSGDRFWEAVRGQGFTRAQYRINVRRELFKLKVLNQRVRGRVNITEEQVRERYAETLVRARRTAQFEAAHIFVPLEAGVSATELSEARARVARVRAQLTGTEDFERAMGEVGGSELGVLSQGDMPESLERAMLELDEGEISQPVRGPAGFHIFLLRRRFSATQTLPSYEDSRMQIFNSMMEQAMRRQEALFLSELRRGAVIDTRL